MTPDPAKEAERLANIIRQARAALEDGRRGDCLKMLKGALPQSQNAPTPPPGGGRAA
mgnify:CR=1 FL=1